ncbi:CotY/CotZ family spore coat protein [Bacillus sp. 1P06AnD]|uniref:CotY/CotZ family spore coat protein n=1 Tax=Bacillus sp. 1P06AnD TaxID=3132208 RepID=UPI0039A3CCA7
MSCGHDKFTNDCVCSTLVSVAEAQERVEDDCRSGCQQAIDELKGRVKIRGFDTIPVLITCNCQPFAGVGALRCGTDDKMFNVIRSFLFRVSEVDEDTCCATLELLKPIVAYHDYESDESEDESRGDHHDQQYPTAFDEFLAALNDAKKIVRTGICITLDLKAATSVTCLPPIHTM